MEAAPECEISYPAFDNQNKLAISALLRQTDPGALLRQTDLLDPPPLIKLSSKLIDQFPTVTVPEDFADNELLPLLDGEAAKTEGGYALFQHQAQCPFRAFAINRLHAELRQLPDLDFDAQERGIVVHKALELFWSKIQSRDALQDLIDTEALGPALEPCITQALDNFKTSPSRQKYFFSMEQERLMVLLEDWLLMESKRENFSVVETEKTIEMKINGLSLKMRVDRIDRIAGKAILLIDYKTGKLQTAKWYQDPIQDPQLPLYLLGQDADGIAFAGVQKGQLQYRVMAKDGTPCEGMKLSPPNQEPLKGQSWDEIEKFWKTQADDLSADFQNGVAHVHPYHPVNTCKHCDLETLCRKGQLLPNPVWSELEENES